MRPTPQETAAGSEVMMPPRDSQFHQPLEYHLWMSELLLPRANTSSRPGPHEATPGPEVSWPPSVSVRTQVSPTALSATPCGLPAPLLLIVSDPVRDPAAAGLKVTLIVQLASGARLVPQLFTWL